MTSWRVSHRQHDDFVTATGDANPFHTDELAARRLPFGRIAVHGMHVALDALERVAELTSAAPRHVTCSFRHPVGVDDELVSAIAIDGDAARVRVTTGEWTVAEIDIGLGELVPANGHVDTPLRAEPEVRQAGDIAGLRGSIAVAAEMTIAATRFPRLVGLVGSTTLAELLTLTRLVGMHVPGLHSLFSSFDVTIGDPPDGEPRAPISATASRAAMAFEVTRFDERFSMATIAVAASTVHGTLTAFVRPQPVEPTLGATRPDPLEFDEQRWLVVGGSRGLGALAVMLLDLGGAEVRFTYHLGADDARRVAASTGRAVAHRLDVLDPAPGLDELDRDRWRPTHVAYFASPPIFLGVSGTYSTDLEQRFRRVYVDGLIDLIGRLDRSALRGVLSPSSVAAANDVAGLAEYAAVKREGEAACARLEADGLRVHAPRFPRLRTDQSTSFVPVEFGDAPTEVLAALRVTSGREHRPVH